MAEIYVKSVIFTKGRHEEKIKEDERKRKRKREKEKRRGEEIFIHVR